MAVTGPETGFREVLTTNPTNANSLWGVGFNDYGQLGNGTTTTSTSLKQVGTLTDWNQVSSAYRFCLGIKTDGTLWGWGINGAGQLGLENTTSYSSPVQVGLLTDWKQVATGQSHSAAVKTDGTLWTWGQNSFYGYLGQGDTIGRSSPTQVGLLTDWKLVSGGNYFTAAVKTDGTLWTWGSGYNGRLGLGDIIHRSSPVQVGTLQTWSQVSCGYTHAAAIKTDGTLWTWGYNNTYGALGLGDKTDRSSPVQVGSLTNWTQVSCGVGHTAAINSDGGLWAWGRNEYGQIGSTEAGGDKHRSSPIQVGTLSEWSLVSCGNYLTAAIRRGILYYAGALDYDKRITDPVNNRSILTQLTNAPVWKSIGLGSSSVNIMAIPSVTGTDVQDLGNKYVSKDYLLDVYPNLASATGNRTSPGLWAIGYNGDGELGLGDLTDRSSPVQVGSLTTWKQVSCGEGHTAAIKTDGTLWTWGNNGLGRLGRNNLTNYSSPVQVGSLTNWKQVSGGDQHTAAVKTDGTLWTWGSNSKGQLGDNTITHRSSPVQVGSLTDWKQVSAGIYHTASVKTDGTLWTWGHNNYGQLGDNSARVHRSSPVQVGSLTNWKLVATAVYHTAAVKTDGTLWTWGHNNQGQLGLNDAVFRSSPTQVGSLTNWKLVACNKYHTAAIKTDGTLWTWGSNNLGEAGLPVIAYYSSPVQVGTLTNWKFVACGAYHTTSIKTDGTLWSWGYNTNGQLADPTLTHRSSPVQVGSMTTWKQVASGYNQTIAIQDGYY